MSSTYSRNPSSVVGSLMDLYTCNDIDQECSCKSRQHSQVEKTVGYGKEDNVAEENATPESGSHCDVLGIGGRRMMQSVPNGSWLVETRPVHRPSMICIFDPVCPHQPREKAQQEPHLATTCSQPL